LSTKGYVDKALSIFADGSIIENEVAVVTQCLFPSNGCVTVFVSGGRSQCVVSDRGETARVVESHGIHVPHISRWLDRFCKRTGLQVRGTHIVSPEVSISDVASMIILVANTAASAARYAVENYAPKIEVDLIEKVSEKLVSAFGKSHVAREVELSGASNRVYRFDFVVQGGEQPILVVDHVSPHANSINAKAAAHIDLGRKRNGQPMPSAQQAIVYDSDLNWQAPDLAFLQTAAQLVPYARMTDALTRKSRESLQ
jgi:hypothetical protein